MTGRKHRLLDKTPRNALRVPFVDALFPDARYIYLQRDGRENVNSLINAWRTPRYRSYELPQEHSIPGV
ncbi:MAG TPA: sulfotransferase, partial [Actinomycetota bacterium]|nr:sulfotransferase [Actinomycetota bacterium]